MMRADGDVSERAELVNCVGVCWMKKHRGRDRYRENLEKWKTNTDKQLAIRKTEQDTPKICNTYRLDDK